MATCACRTSWGCMQCRRCRCSPGCCSAVDGGWPRWFAPSQTIAVSYALLLSILVWQALRGQSVIRPDSLTLTALGVWAVATMLAVTAASSQRNGVGAALHARG